MKRAGSVSKYITKSGDRLWRYRFDAEPVDGKRQVISKQGFATRGAAMNALPGAIKEYQESKTTTPPPPPPPPKETVADWLRIWLRDYAPHRCAPKTLERYWQLASYILDAKDGEPAMLAAASLVDLKHTTVEAALYALLRMPAKRRKHLSPKSVREIASVLGVSLNEAFRLDKIFVNPLLKVRLPKAEKKKARSLTQQEIASLRAVCRGDWTYALVETYLATGARRGELLALEWPDFDWMTGTLTISKSLEETKKGLRVKAPKNDKTRRFRVGPSTIAVLRFVSEEQQERRRLLGDTYDGQLVFADVEGAHLSPLMVSQNVKRRIEKAGIRDASLHTLRHTHASHLLSDGVPIAAVSERMGHADVNVTLRVYAHMLPTDDARAADSWENVGRVQ